MRRLYLKVWLALVAAVFVSLIGGAVTARLTNGAEGELEPPIRAFAVGLATQLPDQPDARRAALTERARRHSVALSLYAPDRSTLLASSTERPLPRPRLEVGDHWVRSRAGAGMAIELDDGRWLVVGHRHPSAWQIARHVVPVLAVVFGILAAAAWPIARMTTRRLDQLRAAVEDLGSGELSRRVPVDGADEVADLARSFNASAARIEALVDGQRRVLASASHELRSPLTRIRMAAELAREAEGPDRSALLDTVDENIVELDALIADVLLSSRLDAGAAEPPEDEVDLGLLARQEAQRVGAEVEGDGVAIGDERMLRRLVRNLLENAQRYGAPPIRVEVADGLLAVLDGGPGIPADQREAVFEPFYRPQGHKESDGGVGLGLALVRRIATHHGAVVTIASDPTRIEVRWHGNASASGSEG